MAVVLNDRSYSKVYQLYCEEYLVTVKVACKFHYTNMYIQVCAGKFAHIYCNFIRNYPCMSQNKVPIGESLTSINELTVNPPSARL